MLFMLRCTAEPAMLVSWRLEGPGRKRLWRLVSVGGARGGENVKKKKKKKGRGAATRDQRRRALEAFSSHGNICKSNRARRVAMPKPAAANDIFAWRLIALRCDSLYAR